MSVQYLPAVSDILAGQSENSFALIVLNQPLSCSASSCDLERHLLRTLFGKAQLTICADGGANYLYETLHASRNNYIPDIICGDLDSLNTQAQSYYANKGTKIKNQPSQDENDFLKCIRTILQTDPYCNVQYDYIITLGALHGRFDQSMASIHALYVAAEFCPTTRIILLSIDSYTCLITPGHHKLDVNTGFEGKWCGLLPIGSRCNKLKTTGLKWNLPIDGREMAFGSLISSSNTFDGSGEVTITTDTSIIWSMGISIQID